uniref:Uncharacterized protein n=1 Tax=Anopheles minimus TaxID=112268 RepID=A0A182WNI1_9DIPT
MYRVSECTCLCAMCFCLRPT